MNRLFLITALIASSAHAASQQEVDVTCDLEKARTEVTAAVLEAPYMYGSLSTASNDKGVTLGAGYSFAGKSRARLIRDAADSRCTALGATLELDEQQRWLLVAINKAGARAELETLLTARALAIEQVKLLQAQLKAQTVTLAEYNTARQVQLTIDTKMSQLKMLLAEASQPTSVKSVRGLLETAKAATTRAAELEARANAEAAWDVSAVVGARKDFTASSNVNASGIAAPYVGLTFRWSFGSAGADKAVTTVKDRAERLFVVSQAGYVASADRLLSQVTEAINIEREREANLTVLLRESEALMASFKSLDTALALNTKRALSLQAIIQRAELAGVQRRITEYQAFTQRI